MENKEAAVGQKAAIERHRTVTATMRFDITLPHDLPRENAKEFAVEKFKKICERLNAGKGVRVAYTLQGNSVS